MFFVTRSDPINLRNNVKNDKELADVDSEITKPKQTRQLLHKRSSCEFSLKVIPPPANLPDIIESSDPKSSTIKHTKPSKSQTGRQYISIS